MTRFRYFAACLLMAFCMPVSAADRIRVVAEGGIRDEWTLPPGYKLAMPVYPAARAEQRAEVCVAIGYLINPDGSTSDFALLKSWTSADISRSDLGYWADFANAAAEALSQWHFQPRSEVKTPRPVYTVATMLFAAGSPASRSHCAVPNPAIRLRELSQDSNTRRKMGALFDRLELDPLREQNTTRQPRM